MDALYDAASLLKWETSDYLYHGESLRLWLRRANPQVDHLLEGRLSLYMSAFETQGLSRKEM